SSIALSVQIAAWFYEGLTFFFLLTVGYFILFPMKGNLIFYCTLCCLSLSLLDVNEVFGADTEEVKSELTMEGDSVTLNTDLPEIQRDEQILWMFGPQGIRIAELYKQKIDMFDSNVTFGDRLQIDSQTGSLTIRNIRTEHTGLYNLQITSNRGTSYKSFNVTVYALLPVPVITSDSSQCFSSERSSGQNCSLMCSAVNVSDVRLSCVSDLNNSLPLEVEYQDNNTYSCVLNNTISNQTTHLNMDLCKECPSMSAVINIVYFYISIIYLPNCSVSSNITD
ncbi:hypothetical protein PO909_027414, partial [Leuciscus waleckii]